MLLEDNGYDVPQHIIRSYIIDIMSESSEAKEALIYMVKDLNLYPQYKHLIETIITFG